MQQNLFVCQCSEDNFGERDGGEDRYGEKELFPVQGGDEHAERIGEEP